jgi:hypothetical protein
MKSMTDQSQCYIIMRTLPNELVTHIIGKDSRSCFKLMLDERVNCNDILHLILDDLQINEILTPRLARQKQKFHLLVNI